MRVKDTFLALLVCATSATSHATSPEAPQSAASLRTAVERAIRSGLSEGRLYVEVSAPDPRLRLAPCGLPLDTTVTGRGTERSTVRVSCGGPARWSIYMTARIESEVAVFRLLRGAQRGETLGPADVRPETLRVPGVSVDYVTTLSQIEEQHLRRSRPAGSVLMFGDFQTDPVIRRGEAVVLVARIGAIEVRSNGRALADAQAGGRVRVQSEASLKVVEGRADEERRVWVTP